MVAAVPQHSVAAHVQLPIAACSAPVGDTVVAARPKKKHSRKFLAAIIITF